MSECLLMCARVYVGVSVFLYKEEKEDGGREGGREGGRKDLSALRTCVSETTLIKQNRQHAANT